MTTMGAAGLRNVYGQEPNAWPTWSVKLSYLTSPAFKWPLTVDYHQPAPPLPKQTQPKQTNSNKQATYPPTGITIKEQPQPIPRISTPKNIPPQPAFGRIPERKPRPASLCAGRTERKLRLPVDMRVHFLGPHRAGEMGWRVRRQDHRVGKQRCRAKGVEAVGCRGEGVGEGEGGVGMELALCKVCECV